MIILLVINIIQIYAHEISKQVFYLYPTEGEFYQNYLSDFQKNQEITCKMHPQVPNVQLMNQCEEIFRTRGNQFISLSSNNTHFGTLSNKNEVVIYQWENQIIQQVGQSVHIESSFICFNINLSKGFSILIDCYYNNEFILIQLFDAQSIIAYSIQSTVPTSTKIQSIVNGTDAFAVYAQYFGEYSILSLFSSSFYNLSSLNNKFVDFDIPITISPNIYAITNQEIFQLSISSDFQFYYKSNFSSNDLNNITTINTYYNYQTNTQCDQIQLLFLKQLHNLDVSVASLIGCEGKILQVESSCPIGSCDSIQKVLQNNQYIIYQSPNVRTILQKQTTNSFNFYQNNLSNSLLYLNYDNELFQFNQEIVVYKVSLPYLQINLTNLENSGEFYNFTMTCINKFHPLNLSAINIYVKILSKQDTNIYVMSTQGFHNYLISQDTNFSFYIFGYSGQLLNYTLNTNESYFNVNQTTIQQFGEIPLIFSLGQFLSIVYPFDPEYYFIGYTNESLDVWFCIQKSKNQSFELALLNSFNICVNASSLQVAYSIYPQRIITGLSANDTIYLFYFFNDNISIINYSNYTFEYQFSQFVLTYNSVIILIPNLEIQIMTFNFTNAFTLNQSSINKLFNNIQFNPIQIVVNTQLESSLLYINNVNEVIIVSIDLNNYPIPISLIHFNFTIKQINLVNELLIVSYQCNNHQNICFQVWNFQNLPKYYYVKNLYSVNFDNNIIIQSDNQFLYVTFSNYTVYVYNPSLPYHMSLYQMLQLNSPIICSSAYKSDFYLPQYQYYKSLIFQGNSFYEIDGHQKFVFIVNFYNSHFNNQIKYPEFIYNYNVTTGLNDTAFQQTPNQSIVLYSNFTIFYNQGKLQINLGLHNIIPKTKNFTYPMNLILDRQADQCELMNLDQNYNQNQQCSLTQYSQNSSNISNFQNYSIITSINNEYFALQNNSFIQTINNDLSQQYNLSYSNLNLSECLKSTSYIYTLYSICLNTTSQYLLNFTLNSFGLIVNVNTKQLPKMFYNITKLSIIINQIFILGSFDQSKKQQLYWYNQLNNTFQQISNSNSSCQDFSIAQIVTTTSAILSQQQLIIFYILIGKQFQSLFYQFITVQYNQITFHSNVYIRGYTCNNNNICSGLPNSYVLILETFYNQAIILLSNFDINYINQIINFRIQQHSLFYDFVQTIPNYGNLNNTGNSIYQNGVLMQQFSLGIYENQSQFIVGVYYLNNLFGQNLLEPILMQGSFFTTISDYAIIINQMQQNGTSLYILNQSIYTYPISTWNVTCLLNRKTQNNININIFCSNIFSSGNYQITFYPPQLEKSSRRSIYALIIIIALLLLYFYIKVKSTTKNLGYLKSEIEL